MCCLVFGVGSHLTLTNCKITGCGDDGGVVDGMCDEKL